MKAEHLKDSLKEIDPSATVGMQIRGTIQVIDFTGLTKENNGNVILYTKYGDKEI